ncbi:hypothetical protein AB1E18_019639 [Capra hircus]
MRPLGFLIHGIQLQLQGHQRLQCRPVTRGSGPWMFLALLLRGHLLLFLVHHHLRVLQHRRILSNSCPIPATSPSSRAAPSSNQKRTASSPGTPSGACITSAAPTRLIHRATKSPVAVPTVLVHEIQLGADHAEMWPSLEQEQDQLIAEVKKQLELEKWQAVDETKK